MPARRLKIRDSRPPRLLPKALVSATRPHCHGMGHAGCSLSVRSQRPAWRLRVRDSLPQQNKAHAEALISVIPATGTLVVKPTRRLHIRRSLHGLAFSQTSRYTGFMSGSSIRQSRRCRATGTIVTIYDLDAVGAPLDRCVDANGDGDPRWLTMCEDHGNNVGHDTFSLARWHAPEPDGWCEECRQIIEAKGL